MRATPSSNGSQTPATAPAPANAGCQILLTGRRAARFARQPTAETRSRTVACWKLDLTLETSLSGDTGRHR
jgi:hypothetical protein